MDATAALSSGEYSVSGCHSSPLIVIHDGDATRNNLVITHIIYIITTIFKIGLNDHTRKLL